MGAGDTLVRIAVRTLAPLSPAQRLAVAAELVAGVNDPGCALALRQIGELALRAADDLFDRQFTEFHEGVSHDRPSARGAGPR
jgi:hypothetical protein